MSIKFIIIAYYAQATARSKATYSEASDNADYAHHRAKELSLQYDWVQIYSIEDDEWTNYISGNII